MKKVKILICLVVFLWFNLLVTGCQAQPDYGIAEVFVFGTGKADAILITTENFTVMIDAGENRHGQMLADELLNLGLTEIDYLIITHFHKDHVGGVRRIIENLTVNNVIVPDYGKSSRRYNQFVAATERAGLEPFVLTETIKLTLDKVEFTLYPPGQPYAEFGFAGNDENEEEDEDDYDDIINVSEVRENDFSIVTSVRHGNNDFLFTGDAVAKRLAELLLTEDIINTDYDFLKVPHHGRYNELSTEFISVISPKYAVITCSLENQPDIRVISALLEAEAEMFFTVFGGVHFISDGSVLNAAAILFVINT
ncbi:MAG: MBL fold metallo-hydrolase [Oscillospiraceae bacterium]|jgi:beta-lactamase superfamily II metal-dependent hydrolase|nr:MBL fold metallo-hydrolase [Oscillospiraceae bacterium]